jgi:hypothetical protein
MYQHNQMSRKYRLLSRTREVPMDAIAMFFAIVVALVGLDVVAVRFGTDSRDPIGDDHAR